ncbi:hypothetical protein EYR36_011982 [Pleurotus pulmonarius]|nr:hypothetical protein EYR36_011982 [Pleurotus pulmonarius]
MPRLHTLDIRFFALPASVCMVPQLRRLSYMPPGGNLTTMSTVLSFLRCTPSLEQLEIGGTLQVGTIECPKVELHKLSLLTLATMQFENSALFRFIDYPPSLRMQFISHSPLATSDLVISDLVPVLTGSELGSHIETLAFSATKDKRFSVLATSREGPLLEMSLFRMEGESQPLVKFSALVPCSSAHTLCIRGFPSVVLEDWAALFGRHEQVRELTAEQVDENFIRALLEPLQAGRPPFMQLRRLNPVLVLKGLLRPLDDVKA